MIQIIPVKSKKRRKISNPWPTDPAGSAVESSRELLEIIFQGDRTAQQQLDILETVQDELRIIKKHILGKIN